MGSKSKKRAYFAMQAQSNPPSSSSGDVPQNGKPMERRKMRKGLAKQRRQPDPETMGLLVSRKLGEIKAISQAPPPTPSSTGLPELHVNLFRDLSSPAATAREAAAEALVAELREVQLAFERVGPKVPEAGAVQLEAEKDDGLENCAPSLRYALRRLIRGVSSSRECARQGFALGLTAIVAAIPAIRLGSLMKLIADSLEVSSSTKGQEARECFLGRLFAYGALARSGRVAAEWNSDDSSFSVKDFISSVIALANKKRYLREPAVSIILDIAEKLPLEALSSQVLIVPGMNEWFQKAADNGDPDVLFLALKLQERTPMDNGISGKLLPHPFSSDNFFSRDHLLTLSPCFKESTFCTPRVHSLWPLLVNILVRDMPSQDEDAAARSTSNKKHKRSRKGSSFEEITKNIRCFCEVVIEESFLQSSHDRKHLAFNVVLLMLPILPASCMQVVLSHKFVNCLVDVLSTEGSWLYNAAQHFLKELLKWAGDDDDRRVGVIVSLQKHSNGRFDYLTKTQAVKQLVNKFNTEQGCMLFVHELMNLFVDEGAVVDEPSDQSQTTEENSEMGSTENKDTTLELENSDFLKIWVIDTMPRILKNLKLVSNSESRARNENVEFLETKFRVQREIMKFLAVQGLFSASLGTEVTSFELQEKFTWPKAASSSSLRKMCIEQLQSLLEDAQKGEGLHAALDYPEVNDVGYYFMCFLNTLSHIPSVSLYRILNNEDETTFKKLQLVESKLYHEERNPKPDMEENELRALRCKLHALRYLLIQLLLQVLLHPNEFSEAASELVICCKKAFPDTFHGDSEDEDGFADTDMPALVDVLVDTLLSLLPQSSGAMRFAVEQVFRVFCDDITDDGLLQMLRIVKKDLKSARHQAAGSDDDDEDDDDLLGIEEAEDTDEADATGTVNSDDHRDEGMVGIDATEGEAAKTDQLDSEELSGGEESDVEATKNDELSVSDDSDSGMDDDAMFRVESHLARLFKERKISSGHGHDNANSQLVLFKLRVLSLLEIYLQKNPGKSQVLTVYSHLAQAFVKSHMAEGSEQLGQRIGGILQKKLIKAKDYPKGEDIQFTSLVTLLEKSLKSASRSRRKVVTSLAQSSTFWILKIIHARNFSKSELERVVEIFRFIVADYFDHKNCRLNFGFVKEVIHRYPWIGLQLFGFLLEKCEKAKSEFRQIEALDAVDCVVKSLTATSKGDKEAPSKPSKLLKKNLPVLCELIQKLLSMFPKNKSRRAQVRRFCSRVLHVTTTLNLKKSFLKALKPEAYSACESQLGATFLPFKQPTP